MLPPAAGEQLHQRIEERERGAIITPAAQKKAPLLDGAQLLQD